MKCRGVKTCLTSDPAGLQKLHDTMAGPVRSCGNLTLRGAIPFPTDCSAALRYRWPANIRHHFWARCIRPSDWTFKALAFCGLSLL
jgi:hypothetical protein